ncbi:MAG TPA: ATP phosphoribosyltransferase regulatory subunit [Burkholderiaceae bacterium]|nr:ATP phosphoribosyltransferase regulatory subunit [Burkholderiaceae bacterium]
MARWLLPEGISDVLPLEAQRVEQLRRQILDEFGRFGYELVIPPLIEYVESLLSATAADLDLRTFKLTDQSSGRLMGVRADTTPQVARIDAHILNRAGVTRLCYAGSVLHARPLHPLAPREVFQIGAELYGSAMRAADAEVLQLATRSLRVAGIEHVRLDLGHSGIVRALLAMDGEAAERAAEIVAALSVKDGPALRQVTLDLQAPVREGLRALVQLHGGRETIEAARSGLPPAPGLHSILDDLLWLADHVAADVINFDLADVHGSQYHTGMSFATYLPDGVGSVLRGGRYDDIGRAFGRARPATGFSIDLRELARLTAAAPAGDAILAPHDPDAGLAAMIDSLRAAGETVVVQLAVDEPVADGRFARTLRRQGGVWQVVPIE